MSKRGERNAVYEELLAQSVRTEQGCLEWAGYRNHKGYARFGKSHKSVSRRVLEASLGRKLEAGECALHRCDNPPCVAADHLFVGTIRDNNLDMARKGRSNPQKLTEGQIKAIREDSRAQVVIAKEYGISQQLVSFVKNRVRGAWA